MATFVEFGQEMVNLATLVIYPRLIHAPFYGTVLRLTPVVISFFMKINLILDSICFSRIPFIMTCMHVPLKSDGTGRLLKPTVNEQNNLIDKSDFSAHLHTDRYSRTMFSLI